MSDRKRHSSSSRHHSSRSSSRHSKRHKSSHSRSRSRSPSPRSRSRSPDRHSRSSRRTFSEKRSESSRDGKSRRDSSSHSSTRSRTEKPPAIVFKFADSNTSNSNGNSNTNSAPKTSANTNTNSTPNVVSATPLQKPAPIKEPPTEPTSSTIDTSSLLASLNLDSLLSDIEATKAALQQQVEKRQQNNNPQNQLLNLQKQRLQLKRKREEAATSSTDSAPSSTSYIKSNLANERAKSIAEIQQKINQKLQIKPQPQPISRLSTSTRSTLPSSTGALPPPLLLNEQGREVDVEGNLVSRSKAVVATTMINKRQAREKVFKMEKPVFETDPEKNPYYDPRMKVPKTSRAKRTFNFVEAGSYMKKGQRYRTKLARELLTVQPQPRERHRESDDGSVKAEAGTDEQRKLNILKNLAGIKMEIDDDDVKSVVSKDPFDVLKELEEEDPIPKVEWWDLPLLLSKEFYVNPNPDSAENSSTTTTTTSIFGVSKLANVNDKKITHLIEHPPKLPPPTEKPPPGPQPLKLTKEESKKMRRRRRAERHREMAEQILLGLKQPLPNKVKLSNMYRVLTGQAVQDPTLIEQKVLHEMIMRMKNHEKRNAERKLKPEQKRAKKLKKMFEDTSLMSYVALFKVKYLGDKKHIFKVEVNATQNHLTGCAILYNGCNMVLVEGGPKSIKRYKKLMLRRIEWNSYLEIPEETDLEIRPKNNTCNLVWEGTVLRPNFKNFRVEQFNTEIVAHKYLKDRGIGFYWDCVKWWKDDPDAPQVVDLNK